MSKKYRYPNSYKLYNNSIEVKNRYDWTCQICKKTLIDDVGIHVHHIDYSKTNHDINNLLCVCVKCHTMLHNAKEYKKKYEYMLEKYKALRIKYKTARISREVEIRDEHTFKKTFNGLCKMFNNKWKRYYKRQYKLWKQTI